MDKGLPTKEAHEYLNIGKTKFYALIKDCKIKPVKT